MGLVVGDGWGRDQGRQLATELGFRSETGSNKGPSRLVVVVIGSLRGTEGKERGRQGAGRQRLSLAYRLIS